MNKFKEWIQARAQYFRPHRDCIVTPFVVK